jgi:hypothetical protein
MRNVNAASDLLKPYDARLMRCYPVSTRINHLANDDEECSRPVELPGIQNQPACGIRGALTVRAPPVWARVTGNPEITFVVKRLFHLGVCTNRKGVKKTTISGLPTKVKGTQMWLSASVF